MKKLQNTIASLIANYLGTNNKVVHITIAQLIQLLMDWKGNKTVSLVQLTSQANKLKAASARENEVLKLTVMTVLAGTDTNVRVNNQLAREGKEQNYEALPTYMEKVNNVLGQKISDPSVKYFITYPFDNSNPKSEYFLNGSNVTKKEIEHLYKPSALKTYESKVQGTDKKIHHMRPKLDSLLALKVDQTIYMIK